VKPKQKGRHSLKVKDAGRKSREQSSLVHVAGGELFAEGCLWEKAAQWGKISCVLRP